MNQVSATVKHLQDGGRRSPRVVWIEEAVRRRYADCRILDVGFVGGYEKPFIHFAIRQQNPNSKVVGVDLDVSGIKKHRIPDTLAADAKELAFKDNSFDAVLLLEVLEHLHCPDSILKELWRVVHPTGELLVTTPNAFAWWNVICHWLLGSLKSRVSRSVYKGYLGAPGHVSFYDPLSLMNVMYESGFETRIICTKNHA